MIVLIAGLGLGLGVHAASSATGPYQTIMERNVFGLKPPADPKDNLPPPPPPSKVVLSGITTLLGNKRALVSVALPGKPQPENYILTEGQREGDIEVLQIDEKAGLVKITNRGIEQTLDFKTDGAKAQPAPSIQTPGVVMSQPPPPGAIPPPNSPLRTIPTRSMRIPGPPPGPGPNSEIPPVPQP
ncbi:MAG TPA: hypothetical protein VK327_00725 [Candidatus Paceibacterota bacterium]|nr:hypothetical protein [Candidatus Paceibacterota bacterium]